VKHPPVWDTNINQALQQKLREAEVECDRLRCALASVRDVQDLGDAAHQIISIALSRVTSAPTNHSFEDHHE
jgi:hypothetical protein